MNIEERRLGAGRTHHLEQLVLMYHVIEVMPSLAHQIYHQITRYARAHLPEFRDALKEDHKNISSHPVIGQLDREAPGFRTAVEAVYPKQ